MTDVIKAARRCLHLSDTDVFDPALLAALRQWLDENEGRSLVGKFPDGLAFSNIGRVTMRGMPLALYVMIGGNTVNSRAEFEQYNRAKLQLLDFIATPKFNTVRSDAGCKLIQEGLEKVKQGRAMLKQSGMPRKVAARLGRKGMMP